jgi:hypothetical protein
MRPEQLMDGEQLRSAAVSMTVPALSDPSAQAAMERLMRAIVRVSRSHGETKAGP